METAAPTPARELPSQEAIAAWVHGEELPALAALFEGLPLARFDALTLQIRKEELLPQHWQVIHDRTVSDEGAFDRLPEVRRLRARLGGGEAMTRRLEALRVAWLELGGKQPALWTVADLLAAVRRLLQHGRAVDFHDLLSAIRDVWKGLDVPHGREQIDILWNCLALIRRKTKP